jgi:hypothetical protein
MAHLSWKHRQIIAYAALNTITVCNLYEVLGHGTLKVASIGSRIEINYQFLLFSLEQPIFRKCSSNHSGKWAAKQLILALKSSSGNRSVAAGPHGV